eukprot:gene7715-9177_t
MENSRSSPPDSPPTIPQSRSSPDLPPRIPQSLSSPDRAREFSRHGKLELSEDSDDAPSSASGNKGGIFRVPSLDNINRDEGTGMLRWRDSVGFKSLELEALALAEDRVRRPEETEVKSPFHLVCCNDSDCEIIVPTTDWDIPVSQSAKVLKKLRWRSRPKRALIVKKPNDKDTTAALHKVHGFLTTRVPPIEVWVEPAVAKDLGAGFKTWEEDKGDDLHKYVDFVIEGDFFITLRMRLCGRIVRKSGEVVKLEDVTALNEVVIDRGPTYSLIQLELFCDGLPLTKVQADGVIIATPTGSTAYSLAAGGPLVHPALTGMLITPICPHTLSFRPMLLPDSVTLKIHVPETSRSNAFIAFDGSHRHELHKGDNVFIKFVTNPVIHMCKDNESADWFQSVNQ